MSLLRMLVGILLLPVCVAASLTTLALLGSLKSGPAHVPAEVLALLAGLALWLFIYFTMTRPVRAYVLGHELTHALWAWMMGARVSGLRVTARGGSVTVSQNNFLITLAPYFFPFYTMLVVAAYGILTLFKDVGVYELYWLGLVGLTWGFHLTFTVSMLAREQSDIRQYGRIFSYVVIYLMNVLGIAIWLVIVTPVTAATCGRQFAADTVRCWQWSHATALKIYRTSVQ